jgi:parvulin-like peptidyl-prolyl isomerase
VVNDTLAPELKKLKPGEHSGVIEAPEGFYILLLEDRHAAHFKPLNDVRGQIERTLANQETKRLQAQWVERLKRKTFVKFF